MGQDQFLEALLVYHTCHKWKSASLCVKIKVCEICKTWKLICTCLCFQKIDNDVKKDIADAAERAKTDPEIPLNELYNKIYYQPPPDYSVRGCDITLNVASGWSLCDTLIINSKLNVREQLSHHVSEFIHQTVKISVYDNIYTFKMFSDTTLLF